VVYKDNTILIIFLSLCYAHPAPPHIGRHHCANRSLLRLPRCIVFARNKILTEFWVSPLQYIPQMVSILVCFVALSIVVIVKAAKGKIKA